MPVQVLHYGGQLHGFLNFDAVLGAGRDGLQRIGAALAARFRGEAAPDRTLELGEAPRARRRLRRAGGELASTWLIGWTSAGRWIDTVWRVALPRTSSAFRWGLRPWLTTVASMQRLAGDRLARIEARQTWPTNGSST